MIAFVWFRLRGMGWWGKVKYKARRRLKLLYSLGRIRRGIRRWLGNLRRSPGLFWWIRMIVAVFPSGMVMMRRRSPMLCHLPFFRLLLNRLKCKFSNKIWWNYSSWKINSRNWLNPNYKKNLPTKSHNKSHPPNTKQLQLTNKFSNKKKSSIAFPNI